MLEPPAHDPLDRPVDMVPGGMKRPGDLQPREFPGPSREELHVSGGEMMLALGPWQDLGDNAACGTVHTPSCDRKKTANPQKGMN